MQFRISTLFWATLMVAASLGLLGVWGLPAAVYWIVGLWWAAGPGGKERPWSRSNGVANLVWLVFLFFLPLGCAMPLLPRANVWHEPTRRSVCCSQMTMIAFGLANYHETYNSFPPAVVRDASDAPAHSWRVLILPYMEEAALYQRYDFTQPWNAPANAAVATAPSPGRVCPSDLATTGIGGSKASYLAIVGPGTVWDTVAKPRAADTRITFVDVADSKVAWAEPKDITAEEFLAAFGGNEGVSVARSPHPGGFSVALADFRRARIPKFAPRALVETLLYEGLTPEAEEELKQLQELQTEYDDRDQRNWLLLLGSRLLAWVGAIVAFGVHAFRLRRGQTQSPASTETVGNAPRE